MKFEEWNDIDHEIALLIRARFSILSIVTYEEWRVLAQLERMREKLLDQHPVVQELAKDLQAAPANELARHELADCRRTLHPILRWSVTDGLYLWSNRDEKGDHSPRPVQLPQTDTRNPVDVILALRLRYEGLVDGIDLSTALVVFCDLHIWLDREDRAGRFNHILIRALRDLSFLIKSGEETRAVILLSPRPVVPLELAKEIQILDYPLPTVEQLERRFEARRPEIVETYGPDCIQLGPDQLRALMQALSGLTYEEAENVLAKSLANNRRLEPADISEALREKRQIIQKDGTLEYFHSDRGLDEVGGLERLLDWLELRRRAFQGEAVTVDGRPIPLPVPKAVLLIGVPGGGKSLVAKAVARAWELPLLRLDIGRIFGGIVGQSEENMRRAIRIAESIAPAVLWLDEVEKAFPRTSGSTDSGTSLRVMNTFLTWLQEKKAPVFVVATGNDIEQVPTELTRKGRFDEIFYVGLPDQEARRKILEIHTRRFPLERDDYDRLARKAQYFTGAEIEQAVSNALFLLPRIGGGARSALARPAAAGGRPDEGLPPEMESLRSPLAQAIFLSLHQTVPLAHRKDDKGRLVLAETLRRAMVLASPASDHFESLPDEQAAQAARPAWQGISRRWQEMKRGLVATLG